MANPITYNIILVIIATIVLSSCSVRTISFGDEICGANEQCIPQPTRN